MSDIGAWIPQLFYDLIGRVLPGSVLMLLAFWLFASPTTVDSLWKDIASEHFPTTLAVLAVLATSYMVGALLGGIGFVVETALRWVGRFLGRFIAKQKSGSAGGKQAKGTNDKPEDAELLRCYPSGMDSGIPGVCSVT